MENTIVLSDSDHALSKWMTIPTNSTKTAMFQPPQVSTIVGACATVHNFAIKTQEP